jgi:hypothetical protein
MFPRPSMIFAAVERWRFRALLGLLLGVMLAQPLVTPLPFGDGAMTVLAGMLFSAAFLELREADGRGAPGVLLIVVWAALSLASRWTLDYGMGVLAGITAVLMTVMLGWATFGALFRERKANLDALAGAIFGFFLLALLFGQIFRALEAAYPGSFSVPGGAPESGVFQYFSLVTITTLGYGDVLPVSPMARILSGIEAAFGTLYIAVLIGRIVGAIGPPKRRGQSRGSAAPED